MTMNWKMQDYIHLPTKNWISIRLTDLLVTLLVNSDIVLSMLFLKQEKIIVDTNKDDIILPTLELEPEPV